MGNITVVVDGQYGSCGKGAVCAYLSKLPNRPARVAIRVGGSQAGHTVLGPCPFQCAKHADGHHPWPLRHIPVAAITDPEATLVIAQGSEIDMAVLAHEVYQLEAAGIKIHDRLYIDPMATLITSDHMRTECAADLNSSHGSTHKGVGAARADRAMRSAGLVRDVAPHIYMAGIGMVEPTLDLIREHLDRNGNAMIEGVQGYGLGLHHPNYPYVTSSDTTAGAFLAMAGLSPRWEDSVYTIVTMRPNPIRIAGNSGPLKGETTWGALGLDPELTTVTRKTRRVGTWDPELARAAVRANGGPSLNVTVALTMCDHVDPTVANATKAAQLTDAVVSLIDQVERDTVSDVVLIGTGPGTMVQIHDIYTL
jgi:adenylosuccinate synthase